MLPYLLPRIFGIQLKDMAKPTIRLWLREDKILKDGTAPIHLIYQVKGVRTYLNTGINLYPFNWDKKAQKAMYLDKKGAKKQIVLYTDKLAKNGIYILIDQALIPLAKDIDRMNMELSMIGEAVRKIERRFEDDGIQYGSRMVTDVYKENGKPILKQDQSNKIVTHYIDRYIDEQSTTLTKGSLTVFKSLKKHLEAFAKVHKRIAFEHMDLAFFKSFQNFLIKNPVYKISAGKKIKIADGLRNTTVAKQLSSLKTILRYAEKSGIAVNNRYQSFEIKREPLPVIALTPSEFDLLFNANLANNDRLARVRDIFCFACCTGLRYSDLAGLKWDNIKNGRIVLTVIKTKQPLTIPLNDYVNVILERYAGTPKPLPVISNQKLNEYIKELAEFVGINENVEIVRFRGAERITNNFPKHELIGAHTGRKTFCTISLERGMSAEQVMAISGHKDYKSFKRYVNVTNEVKTQAVLKAWTMPKELKLVK